jgi:hypothetical protein
MSRSNKRTLRDLSRERPTDEEALALVDAAQSGSPIVTAILGQALVEHNLEEIIRTRFKNKDDASWGRMTGDNGPLSSFSQKIIMGHALGIYKEDTRINLNIIKNVRNVFAHSKKIISFDNTLISNELGQFKIPKNKHFRESERSYHKAPNNTKFFIICVELSCSLMAYVTRSVLASSRNYERKIKKLNHIIEAISSNPRLDYQGGLGLLFADYQNDGPILRSLGLGGLSPPQTAIPAPRKRNK